MAETVPLQIVGFCNAPPQYSKKIPKHSVQEISTFEKGLDEKLSSCYASFLHIGNLFGMSLEEGDSQSQTILTWS